MTIDEIEKDLQKKIRKAMDGIRDRAFEISEEAVDRFYAEYSPRFYERTYQLYNTLDVGLTWKQGSRFQTSVLIRDGIADYSQKSFMKWQDDYGYYNPFAPWQRSNDGWFANSGYDNSVTLETAMFGDMAHGGYASGKGIRNEITNLLRGRISRIYKEELKKAGIPIK